MHYMLQAKIPQTSTYSVEGSCFHGKYQRAKKTQLKTLATKIHGLAVKSANGKKTVQNKAIEKIAVLLNQTIEAEIKQAHAGIASQVRGLAEMLEPRSVRRSTGKKKVTRRKPVVAKKKPERRSGRVKPTEKVAEQTETTTP